MREDCREKVCVWGEVVLGSQGSRGDTKQGTLLPVGTEQGMT